MALVASATPASIQGVLHSVLQHLNFLAAFEFSPLNTSGCKRRVSIPHRETPHRERWGVSVQISIDLLILDPGDKPETVSDIRVFSVGLSTQDKADRFSSQA